MKRKSLFKILLTLGVVVGLFTMAGCGTKETSANEEKDGAITIRVGHFPNITHSQALVGISDGTFQKALGDKVKIDRKLFNAGPAEIEALLAGEIDLGYIGPVPAINGFVKSKGGLQIIAGATNAGAVLVVRDGAGIKSVKDLAGKRVAVPQYGNTQDISLRKILADAGLKSVNKGGNVDVLQVENADILTGFANKELDAALVPEPWGSRLVKNAGGKVLLDWDQVWRQGDYTTAVVIVSKEFLQKHPDLVEKWLAAHVDLTEAINQDSAKYKEVINGQLKELTKKELSPDTLDSSFARLKPTYNPTTESINEFVKLYVENGFLKETPNIDGLIYLDPLNKILKEKGLTEIKQ